MGFLNRIPARQDTYYFRNRTFAIKGADTAANRRTLVSPSHILVNIGGPGFGYERLAAVEIDLNVAASWDTQTPVDYTVPINRAGVDFYIYACRPVSGTIPVILLSAASTFPTGYSATTSRKLGGFHAMPYVTAPTWLAATVTVINYVVQPVTPNATNRYLYRCTARSGDYKTAAVTEPTWPTTPGQTVVDNNVTWTCDINFAENLASTHRFYLFQMGDIHRNSIWDIKDRSRALTNVGMAKGTPTPEDGTPRRWGNIYLSSGDGTVEDSVFGATIKDTIDWNTFVHYAKLRGKRLMRDAEFQEFAFNGNEQTNIAGSADPAICTFPLDTNGKAMISDWGLIGMAGVMYQWLDEQSYQYLLDGSVSAATQVATITYVASLEGVPVYLMWVGPVPYLAANIAADLWITAGSYKIQIKAVADPVAGGGVQVYFRDAAALPLRLYAVVPIGLNCYIPSSNPDFKLPIVYHANPATQGVELRYDNVTHNRLEAINAGGVNATIDLCMSPGWSYYALPGASGQLYKQGLYGDVKLLAGGYWADGTPCGSRYRIANIFRWNTASYVGCRAVSEPV
jgi:hypothetical protein